VRKQNVPVLVTKGSFADPVPGALSQPNTKILLGDDPATSPLSGGLLKLSWDLDPQQYCVLEASGFYLPKDIGSKTFSGDGTNGSPVIARPFFNYNFNMQDADPVAVPNVTIGQITVSAPREFYGAEANFRYAYFGSTCNGSSLAWLLGGRFLSLQESIDIQEYLTDIPGLGDAGNVSRLRENFYTLNRFYGGQAGFEYQYQLGPVAFQMRGAVAVGVNEQTYTNYASTSITTSNGLTSTVNDRGLLVQPSNAGSMNHQETSVVPTAEVRLSYAFNECVRIGAGYNFLYWTKVARPGSQIDRVVNIQALQPFDQIGPARPAFLMQNTDFWAQGFNVSLELSF
jgi:hypothetical protein